MDRINDNNYMQWVERFLDAETTLDQERELYAYFSRHDLPEDARKYRGMFGWYEQMLPSDDTTASKPARIPSVRLLPLKMWQWGCVAAVVALLFTAGYMLRTPPAMYNYVAEDGTICRGYMVRDGKRITDIATITAEMERINSEMDDHFRNIDSYLDDDPMQQMRDEILSQYDSADPEVRSMVEATLTM